MNSLFAALVGVVALTLFGGLLNTYLGKTPWVESLAAVAPYTALMLVMVMVMVSTNELSKHTVLMIGH